MARILLVEDDPRISRCHRIPVWPRISPQPGSRLSPVLRRARLRLLLLNLGSLSLLLLLVSLGAYGLLRRQLYARLEQDLILTAHGVTFSVERESSGFDFSESIYLSNRPLEINLDEFGTTEWLDPQGPARPYCHAKSNAPTKVFRFRRRLLQLYITRRHAGGTGLGLAIACSLAEAMNGHLSVTSRLGHGSPFRLRLPLIW
ncbi:MAG: hypothetical protein KF760_27660 [Candidatus Eremiobacteraeota bacterium]|nr:hypothetical protein [Candidatus Eremiobacteraeota bacterium]MCW5871051.1 hypothetical protein [Candidatus Eremiobacteraeota bacterium]